MCKGWEAWWATEGSCQSWRSCSRQPKPIWRDIPWGYYFSNVWWSPYIPTRYAITPQWFISKWPFHYTQWKPSQSVLDREEMTLYNQMTSKGLFKSRNTQRAEELQRKNKRSRSYFSLMHTVMMSLISSKKKWLLQKNMFWQQGPRLRCWSFSVNWLPSIMWHWCISSSSLYGENIAGYIPRSN